MIKIPGCAVMATHKITERTAEFPHTDQLTDRTSVSLTSTRKKEGRGYMPRRRIFAIAATALAMLTIMLTSLLGPLVSANAQAPVKALALAPTADHVVLASQPVLPAQSTPDTAGLNLITDLAAAEQMTSTSSMFACIREAESNDRYGIVSGAYGILISAWWAFSWVWKPYGNWNVPGEAPPMIQDLVAYHLYRYGGGFGGWHDRCTGRS